MWDELVRERGEGISVARIVHDDDLLPAVARIRREGSDKYLLKEGRVGGTDAETSIEITAAHARAILDGIAADSIEWEPDPDFGWDVATDVPGIEGRDRFILVPRFLYARTERVYEYAARVPALRSVWTAP